MSKLALKDVIPANYGYVVLVAAGTHVLNQYLIGKVMSARKRYDVKYPAMYSETSNEFNCIQRAHQNYLEHYPFFISSLLIGGLQHPRISALAGVAFIVGRIFYARGYSSGDPDKRANGAFPAYLGYFVLLGNMVCFGVVQSGLLSCCKNMLKR